ncbi:MAG: HD domain-containing phosphohydrolase [Myxococcaceae bacterium]
MRLFKTILLLMLVASVVPTVMVGWLSISDTRELLVRDAQELSQERVQQLRLKTEVILDEPTRAAEGLARIPGFFQLSQAEQRSHIAAILNQRRELTALTVFDTNGERIPGLQGFAVKDVPPTEVVEHESRARKLLPGLSDLRYSDVYLSASRHEAVVTMAYPIGDPAKGFIAAEISLRSLTDMLGQQKVGSSGFAYVVDGKGRVVAGRDNIGPGDTGADAASRPVVAHLLRNMDDVPGAETLHVGNFGKGDAQVVGAYSVLPQVGWAVVSEQPIDLAYVAAATMKRRILVTVAVAFVVAIALAGLFSRNVTRPLKGFMDAALKLASGTFGVKVPVSTKNEIGELASTFNYMSMQLEAYSQETGRLYESLESGYLETIVALANSIDSKDPYTRGHSQRVGDLSVEIGRELGLTERELKLLQYGGILHDIGKIGIVESILCKQSRLTDDEMTVMRTHPEIGDSIIQPVSFLASVRAAIRNHHERYDGTGYPDKLKGEAIPLIARIVNCADTFDACTSTRPYQKAMPLSEAWTILERLRGTQLDPKVLDGLKRVLEKKGARLEGSKEPVKLAS